MIQLNYEVNIHFYPRPPGGGRLSVLFVTVTCPTVFLSTPSGWRATGTVTHAFTTIRVISIHALRVEGDDGTARNRAKEF